MSRKSKHRKSSVGYRRPEALRGGLECEGWATVKRSPPTLPGPFVPTIDDEPLLLELTALAVGWLRMRWGLELRPGHTLPRRDFLTFLNAALVAQKTAVGELYDAYIHGRTRALDPLIADVAAQVARARHLAPALAVADGSPVLLRGVGETRKPGSHRGPY